jgi:hypothetical protein
MGKRPALCSRLLRCSTLTSRPRKHRASFRAELARRLSFETEIMLRPGSEILALAKNEPFSDPWTDTVWERRSVPCFFSTSGRLSAKHWESD